MPPLKRRITDLAAHLDVSEGDLFLVRDVAATVDRSATWEEVFKPLPRRQSGYLLVRSADDLPAAAGNVHTLPVDTTVEVAGMVDLGENAIMMGEGSAIFGLDPSKDGFYSTNGGGVLRSTTDTGGVILQNFFIVAPAGPALDCVGHADFHFNASYCSFRGCLSGGRISGFRVQALKSCYLAPLPLLPASNGISFEGGTSKVFLDGCVFEDLSAGAAVTLAASLNAAYVDIQSCFFKFPSSAALALSAHASSTIGAGRFINGVLDADGSGGLDYFSGVLPSTPEWLFTLNAGVRDSLTAGEFRLSSETPAATVISAVDTWVKAVAETVPSGLNERILHPASNRLTVSDPRPVLLTLTGSFAIDAAANNQALQVAIFKNGAIVPESVAPVRIAGGTDERNGAFSALELAVDGDYFEVFVRNTTSDANVTFLALSLLVQG